MKYYSSQCKCVITVLLFSCTSFPVHSNFVFIRLGSYSWACSCQLSLSWSLVFVHVKGAKYLTMEYNMLEK